MSTLFKEKKKNLVKNELPDPPLPDPPAIEKKDDVNDAAGAVVHRHFFDDVDGNEEDEDENVEGIPVKITVETAMDREAPTNTVVDDNVNANNDNTKIDCVDDVDDVEVYVEVC